MRNRWIAAMVACVCVVTTLLVPGPADEAHAAVSRIYGADRYTTAVHVSAAQNTARGGIVYLASGEGFADALAAGPVAAAEQAPLLLSPPSRIPDVVVREIQRLAPRQIVLVGGPTALSATVLNQAQELSPSAIRIAGTDRVATSMLLLDRMRTVTQVSQVWVVSGTNFPDALVAGATAARFRHGIVLTTGDSALFRQFVAERSAAFQRVYIAGGTTTVSGAVEQHLRQVAGTSVARYQGANRYETAVEINRAFAPRVSSATMLLANGESFPDGLVAGVLAARRGAPLFLTPQPCLPTGTMIDEYRRLRIQNTIVIGGPNSVSNNSANRVVCPHAIQAGYDDMIRQVNALRASKGLHPLQWDPRLQSLAQGWSATQTTQSIAHNPDYAQQIFQMGYQRAGENVAWCTRWEPSHPMELWIASPGHYANLVNPNFRYIGVGAAQDANGQWYWTQNFGG